MRRAILFLFLLPAACSSHDSPTEPRLPAQTEACPDGRCAAGLTCVSYYGIAGASGPLFKTCEIPCDASNTACPAGQTCITIADGPGTVCRPR